MYIGERPESMLECFERIRSAVERLTGELDYWTEDYCVFNPYFMFQNTIIKIVHK